MLEPETISLNWKGKTLVVLLAPIALSGAFLSTFVLEVGTALMRAWWELRWEWSRIRMDFLR